MQTSVQNVAHMEHDMEELKELISAIAGLPTLTVWILVGYLVYKLAVVGSVYGVVRYGIEKFVEWRITPQTLQYKIGSKLIDESVAEQLQLQIARLSVESSYGYIHSSDVGRLKQALDNLDKQDFERKQKQKEAK